MCPVNEDDEHNMIPDDVEDKTQVIIYTFFVDVIFILYFYRDISLINLLREI